MADQRVSTLRVRTLIIAGVAVAAHVVLILLLALGIRVIRSPNEPPPLEVTLTRLFASHPKPAPNPAPQAARHPVAPVAPRQVAPSPLPPLPPPVALPENGPIDPRLAAAEAVRGALQGMVRCAHPDEFHLDPAEQAACARRNRQMAAGAPTYTVDPADHARHDPPVASHGMAAHFGYLSPRPGNDLGPLIGPPPAIAGQGH